MKQRPGINIDYDQWQNGTKGKDAKNEFAVEIEGLAWVEGKLWIGLKWPLLKDGKAILLALSSDGNGIESCHPVNLGGRGISDLFYARETRTVYIAANPPGKPEDEPAERARTDRKALYGDSAIFRYTLDKTGNLPEREDGM
ncbi:MAG: hypothetical protein H0W34_00425, partial [Pyrinomonadaceae bacterium]|nr:hypothetical protein [Pyrinomonadaceae bacterium]